MKKPTTYKPVSFAKFAVNKGAGALPQTKSSSDKSKFTCTFTILNTHTSIAPVSSTTPSRISSQLSSKPRLVAKTSSGLRDAAPKSLRSGSKNSAGGPDPLQVWNKNRRKSSALLLRSFQLMIDSHSDPFNQAFNR